MDVHREIIEFRRAGLLVHSPDCSRNVSRPTSERCCESTSSFVSSSLSRISSDDIPDDGKKDRLSQLAMDGSITTNAGQFVLWRKELT